MEAGFDGLPRRLVCVWTVRGALSKNVRRRKRVLVQDVPGLQELAGRRIVPPDVQELFEFRCDDRRWERSPTISVPQQDEKIGPRRKRLRAMEFFEADRNRSLVQRSFHIDPPAQINQLEVQSLARTQLSQTRRYVSL